MNIHYKIVEVWPDDHLIVARYWTDIITEEFLASTPEKLEDGSPARCRSDVALSIPIPAPNESELKEFLLVNAPSYFLKTLEDVQNPEVDTTMSSILDLKGKKYTGELIPKINETNQKELTEEEIQKLIESVMSSNKL
jgi:hypothetical protein